MTTPFSKQAPWEHSSAFATTTVPNYCYNFQSWTDHPRCCASKSLGAQPGLCHNHTAMTACISFVATLWTAHTTLNASPSTASTTLTSFVKVRRSESLRPAALGWTVQATASWHSPHHHFCRCKYTSHLTRPRFWPPSTHSQLKQYEAILASYTPSSLQATRHGGIRPATVGLVDGEDGQEGGLDLGGHLCI